MYRFFIFLRANTSGFACLYIIFYCITSEPVLDDFVDIVKDFTALCVLLEIDNNLMPSNLKSNLDVEEPEDEDMILLLKNHQRYIESGRANKWFVRASDALVFYFAELWSKLPFILITFYMVSIFWLSENDQFFSWKGDLNS